MRWVYSIFSLVWDISDWFRSAYQEVSGWVWPFHYLQHPLYGLYRVFWNLLTPIGHFGDWVYDVGKKVQDILTSEGILGLIKWWFPWLIPLGEWFAERWAWFTATLGDWWDTKKPIVQGWIDIATQGLNGLIVAWDNFWKITFPQWTDKLEVLGSDFGDFFTQKLPTLFDVSYAELWWRGKFSDVTDTINSAFTERESFWSGWQDFKDGIVLFFTDPLDWIKSHVIEPIVEDFNKGFDRGMKGEEEE